MAIMVTGGRVGVGIQKMEENKTNPKNSAVT
jgi:hypothetical protein